MGLGDECVKKLQEGLVIIHKNNGIGKLDMTELVRVVLIANNRWYVKIGKQALTKESDELNRIARDCGVLNFASMVREYCKPPEDLDACLKTWRKLEAANAKNGKVYKFAKSGVEIPEDITDLVMDGFRRLLDGPHLGPIYSSGAGGFKRFASPKTKFTCYTIHYPKLKFDSKEKVEKFIDKMAKCALIPNSLFCCAGSKKVYLAGKKEMK